MAAEARGRVGRMNRFRTNHQTFGLTSITRRSDRNCFRYGRRAFAVGASGAVFGVLSAVVVTLYRHQRYFYVRDKRIGIVLAGWAGYQLLTGFLTPFVDNFAHLGGIIGGALAAMVLDSRLTAVKGR